MSGSLRSARLRGVLRRGVAAMLAALCCLALTSVTHAATWTVGQGGRGLQETVAAAAEGDVVVLPRGLWAGPVVIDKRLTLRGEGGVIDGQGRGSPLRVDAPGAVVDGVKVIRSGSTLSGLPPDACIVVGPEATGALIKGCHVSQCAFGIWVHKTRRAELRGNTVVGSLTGHRSNRGNGIHLFDASHLTIRGNTVSGGRDGIYVSATEDSLIAENTCARTRYGVHYMFSYRNKLIGNRTTNSGSGFAIMSSLHLEVRRNVAEGNEHHGLLFRDVQYSRIADNVLRSNGEGLFFYSSTENTIVDNQVIGNGVGIKVWAGSKRNEVSGNRIVGNRRQVFYVSTQDLVWGGGKQGNRWGDYLGWDADGDGIGERPHRIDSFTSQLTYRFPSAVLLLRSPVMELLTHLERRLPLLRTATVIDVKPLMGRLP